MPDLTNPEAMQKFFLQEVQTGEELLAAGAIFILLNSLFFFLN